MDLFSSNNDSEFSDVTREQVIDFIAGLHPEDKRDPYQMVELIFNVPENLAKDWVQQKATSLITSVSQNQQPKTQEITEKGMENLIESFKLIKKSMLKLEAHNQALIQQWKRKKAGRARARASKRKEQSS